MYIEAGQTYSTNSQPQKGKSNLSFHVSLNNSPLIESKVFRTALSED